MPASPLPLWMAAATASTAFAAVSARVALPRPPPHRKNQTFQARPAHDISSRRRRRSTPDAIWIRLRHPGSTVRNRRILLLVTHDFAGMQFDHTLAHGVDDFLVMRCHDDGGASAVDASSTSIMPSDVVGSRFPVARRPAESADGSHSSRNGHTLCLTAGKLVRIVVFLTGETDSLQHFRH